MQEYFKRFGGSEFVSCKSIYPQSIINLKKIEKKGLLIPRGEGNSYVEASFSDGSKSVNMKNFNKIINFDKERLTIELETGVTLGKLYNFLLANDCYISIQPGYPLISIGGCIGANVHGKNPYKDGLFENIVEEMKLLDLKKNKILILNRKKNTTLFNLTLGGIGLTGIVLSVKLKVKKIESFYIQKNAFQVKSFFHAIELLNKIKDDYEMFYVWIDLTTNNLEKSDGLLFTGDFIEEKKEKNLITFKNQRNNDFKFNFYNKFSIKLINKVFKVKENNKKVIDLSSFLFPAVNNNIYFMLFGKSGLVEQQFIIPFVNIDKFLKNLQLLLKKENPLIVLATIKLFKGNQKYLNFRKNGYCITFDYCYDKRSIKFIKSLYKLITEYDGISNIIKDDLVKDKTIKKQYGKHFNEFKKKLSDYMSGSIYSSNLSKRIGL